MVILSLKLLAAETIIKSGISYTEEDIVCDCSEFLDSLKDYLQGRQNEGLLKAADLDDLQLVHYFIYKGATDWQGLVQKAASQNNQKMLDLIHKHNLLNPNWGMYGAAIGGHSELVKHFIDKGADQFNWGMYGATKGNHRTLIEYFIDKGANDWNLGMVAAAKTGNKDLLWFFANKPRSGRAGPNWESAYVSAIERDQYSLLDSLTDHPEDIRIPMVLPGFNGLDWLLVQAAIKNKKELVELFINKGAKTLEQAEACSRSQGHFDLAAYLKEVIEARKTTFKLMSEALYNFFSAALRWFN